MATMLTVFLQYRDFYGSRQCPTFIICRLKSLNIEFYQTSNSYSILKLVLEVGEKEALLRKLSKQSRTVNKMKRGESAEYILPLMSTHRSKDSWQFLCVCAPVSQLVTEEFTEMSQKLEMEQGLRQHAEVFAHQVLF